MKKWIVIVLMSLVALGGLITYDNVRFHDGKLHVIFCNVGQGDAVLIRSPGGKNILVDGGPDKSVMNCLAEHLPFWERTIHEIILTHPHQDHYFGIHYVIDRYIALTFDSVPLESKSEGYTGFMEAIKRKGVKLRKLTAGDKFSLPDGVRIIVAGPEREYLQAVSLGGIIAEKGEQASMVLLVSYGKFDLLLTGDSQASGLESAGKFMRDIDIIQAPHHGSNTGLNMEVLDLLNPTAAVISVGKNNYGHPGKDTLRILGDKDIKILRTDKTGDVEVVADDEQWMIRGKK